MKHNNQRKTDRHGFLASKVISLILLCTFAVHIVYPHETDLTNDIEKNLMEQQKKIKENTENVEQILHSHSQEHKKLESQIEDLRILMEQRKKIRENTEKAEQILHSQEHEKLESQINDLSIGLIFGIIGSVVVGATIGAVIGVLVP